MTTTDQQARDFVAEAERQTNERDVAAIRTVFAPDGRWTAIIDGMVVNAEGIDQIEREWAAMCAFMDTRRMFVSKSLVSFDEQTIVNEWTARIGQSRRGRGIEVWHRGPDGSVVDQHLYGFLDPRGSTDPVQAMRMLSSHPRTVAAFVRARRPSRQ